MPIETTVETSWRIPLLEIICAQQPPGPSRSTPFHEILIDKVGEKIHEPKPHGPTTYGDQAKALENRGAVMLAGVSLVDIEYQVEPAAFLSKEVHRLIYTYEDGQHQLTRYQTGAAMTGNKAELANTAINIALNARMWAELGYLLPRYEVPEWGRTPNSGPRPHSARSYGANTAAINLPPCRGFPS